MPYGVQAGDLPGDRAVVWSRADRPARMIVESRTDREFRDARRVSGPWRIDDTDFTPRLDLPACPPSQGSSTASASRTSPTCKALSEPVAGRFRTPPGRRRDVRFVWSGDTAGQGWGINPGWGGMQIYEAMRRPEPDFFVHCGDTIYADGPLRSRGRRWRTAPLENVVTRGEAQGRRDPRRLPRHHPTT